MYQQSYPLMNHANLHSSTSPEEVTGWGERYVHALQLLFSGELDVPLPVLTILVLSFFIQKPAATATQRLPKLAPDECIRNASDPGTGWRQSILV
jgi:hypothetical protein